MSVNAADLKETDRLLVSRKIARSMGFPSLENELVYVQGIKKDLHSEVFGVVVWNQNMERPCLVSPGQAVKMREDFLEWRDQNPTREYTDDEIADQFMKVLWSTIRYWDKLPEDKLMEGYEDSGKSPCQKRLEGLAFSILNMLDGTTMGLPGFICAVTTAEEAAQYHRDQGENWYPYNDDAAFEKLKGVLPGALHEMFHDYDPDRRKKGVQEDHPQPPLL